MNNTITTIDYYPLFILIMMISSNFLAEIFPCRFQELLSSNNYIKHLFGYLTLVFFVSLNINNLNTSLSELFKKSLILYLGFILLTKTNKNIFLVILVLLGLLYIIHLKKTIEEGKKGQTKEEVIIQKQYIEKLDNYKKLIKNIIAILLVFGFVLYLGEKKKEYGKSFNYLTFLIGKPNCKKSSPDVNIVDAFQEAFIK